jgi:hypothetical protein
MPDREKCTPNGEIGMIISGIYRLMKNPFLQINYALPMVKNECPQKEKCIKLVHENKVDDKCMPCVGNCMLTLRNYMKIGF